MKKHPILRILIGILCVLFLGVLSYLAYVIFTYHRIPDQQDLEIQAPLEADSTAPDRNEVSTKVEYGIVTYNIGFGAYTPEYTFFMDGGVSAIAESRESETEMTLGAGSLADSLAPDFILFQEMDLDATRSWHVNQREIIETAYFPEYYSTFAVNYDSAYLFYPFYEPIGKSLSGIDTLSRYQIEYAKRRSLPIASGFNKYIDLDRCYSISELAVDNGKKLYIYNLHMSAYGNSAEIREGQIQMLCEDIAEKYQAGNYVLVGGDFNHDLKALNTDEMTELTWAQPFDRERLPEGFSFVIDQLSSTEKAELHDTARNNDIPYTEGVTMTVSLDGFIVSDNITAGKYEHINSGYSYSDHDPVYMKFQLQ